MQYEFPIIFQLKLLSCIELRKMLNIWEMCNELSNRLVIDVGIKI